MILPPVAAPVTRSHGSHPGSVRSSRRGMRARRGRPDTAAPYDPSRVKGADATLGRVPRLVHEPSGVPAANGSAFARTGNTAGSVSGKDARRTPFAAIDDMLLPTDCGHHISRAAGGRPT